MRSFHFTVEAITRNVFAEGGIEAGWGARFNVGTNTAAESVRWDRVYGVAGLSDCSACSHRLHRPASYEQIERVETFCSPELEGLSVSEIMSIKMPPCPTLTMGVWRR